jgi:hypothetical protein
MKKIIIIGSRRRDSDEDYIQDWNEFRKWYEDGDIIVSGGCPKGGDRFAEVIARKLGLTEDNGKLIIHTYPLTIQLTIRGIQIILRHSKGGGQKSA